MSDAAELKFNAKDRANIQKCLSCPLKDCKPIACPYLITDESKAYPKYRAKVKRRKEYEKKNHPL